jgi:hypothetical protein
LLASPVPTHTIEGSEGATATSPIVNTALLSKTGSQVMPLLTVFQRPPEAVAAKTMRGSLSTTVKSSMRPAHHGGPDLAPFQIAEDSVEAGLAEGRARRDPEKDTHTRGCQRLSYSVSCCASRPVN